MIGPHPLSRRLLLAGVIFLIPLVLMVCGSTKKPATVEGKVTVDGTPANTGNVVFTGANGQKLR